jgi:hypothetical protein
VGSGLPLPSPIHLTGRGADINLNDDPLKPEEGPPKAATAKSAKTLTPNLGLGERILAMATGKTRHAPPIA